MGTHESHHEARIEIAPDGMVASVVLPACMASDWLTVEWLAQLAGDAGVVIDDALLARLGEIVETQRADPRDRTEELVRGAEERDGTPARLDWRDGLEPPDDEVAAEPGKEGHYHSTAFPRIEQGEMIAMYTPATPGVDGRTVTGLIIRAQPGRPLRWKFDGASVECVEGRVVAKRAGVLQVQASTIRVIELLEVPDVDFSTGNINIEGSLHVRRAVQDRFVIKATEHVVIDGLVESATIECGGDLMLQRGMAARERGRLDVGGDAEVGYLNSVRGRIGGCLICRRELINCELSIGSDLEGDRAVIIGGEIRVKRSAKVAAIGSSAEAPTRVVLGRLRELKERRRALLERRKASEGALSALIEELKVLAANKGRLTPAQRERSTRFNGEISAARTAVQDVVAEIAAVDEMIRAEAPVELFVIRAIYPRTTIVLGDYEFTFSKTLPGPVQLGMNAEQRLFMSRGSSKNEPIEHYAAVREAA